MAATNPNSNAKDMIKTGSNLGLPSSPHQVQGGHCEAAQTSGAPVKGSKLDEATAEPSTNIQTAENASATTKRDSQGLASNEPAAAQGINDRSTSQRDAPLPSSVIDKDQRAIDAGLDGHDKETSIAKDQPDLSRQVDAATDVNASSGQHGRPSDKTSSPGSSSSSPLQGALNAAEKSIFDAYKDLVAHLTAVSKDGQPDELLISALCSVEAAMKNIIAAQLAAASSATHGSGAESVGYDGAPSQEKQLCRRPNEGQLAETQSSKSEISSARQQGAPSTTTPQHMRQPSGVPMLTGQSSSKPDGPLDDATTTAKRISKKAGRSSKLLVSMEDLEQSEAYKRWHDQLESLWPGAGATDFLDGSSFRDRKALKDSANRGRDRHVDWDFARHRMKLNAPKGKGKADHYFMPGKQGMPLPRSMGVPLPTILRSTAERGSRKQDGPQHTEWSSRQVREHRL